MHQRDIDVPENRKQVPQEGRDLYPHEASEWVSNKLGHSRDDPAEYRMACWAFVSGRNTAVQCLLGFCMF